MQLDRLYIKEAYETSGRFNHSFCGSILDVLKLTQHLYNRKDVANAYRFIANIIEKGDFDWSGKKPLKAKSNFANMKANKGDVEPIASSSDDITPTTAD